MLQIYSRNHLNFLSRFPLLISWNNLEMNQDLLGYGNKVFIRKIRIHIYIYTVFSTAYFQFPHERVFFSRGIKFISPVCTKSPGSVSAYLTFQGLFLVQLRKISENFWQPS